MSTQIKIGNITMHRVVEQEQPVFDVFEFFPTLTKEVYAENRGWLESSSM